MIIPRSPAERFWPKVAKGEGCWLWRGAILRNGYGSFAMTPGRPMIVAHRAAWALTHGDIPAGMQVCHTCDVRACVNPAHMFLGTQSDNLHDMTRKGRGYSHFRGASHCKRGHEFTPENTYMHGGSRHCRMCQKIRYAMAKAG